MTIIPLILFPCLTAAYNLDVQHPTIYETPASNNRLNRTNDSYFGYTVLLHSRKRTFPDGTLGFESWLFVGAPRADYEQSSDYGNRHVPKEPGIVYRCPLPNECKPINVSHPDDEFGFIDQVNRHTTIEKKHGWLGAAMSLDPDTDTLIVCAPRTVVKIYTNPTGMNYQNTMQGFCYRGQASRGNLHMEDKNMSNYNFNSSKVWYNPLNGFAVHYPTSKKKLISNFAEPIIGSPKHEFYGSIHKMGQHETVELPIGDDVNQFGYALTSGFYFHEKQLMVVGGAPGWQYVGQVAVMESRTDPPSIIVTINGKEVGEFFGSSLATGDMNKDSLDDLIVGAPHWNNDNGRVHIFLGNKAGFYEADILLEGTVDDALYGYALTSGDLDGDGFDDLIVGAPWEDSGVIYVYNGEANLRDISLLAPSQRIAAADIDENIRTFGFSLAKPVDINNDSFPEVAVGAYASGHVVILKSKPVIKIAITLETTPKIVPRNATSCKLEVCVHALPPAEANIKTLYSYAVVNIYHDGKLYLQENEIVMSLYEYLEIKCDFSTLELQRDISNYLDVIQIVGQHHFHHAPEYDECASNGSLFTSPCPVEYKNRSAITRTNLAFDIGCGIDDICHAYIVTELYFRGIRNSTWIIGSDDLSLVLEIGNRAEPAYSTTVAIDVPKGIHLKSLRPSCQETGTSVVTCDVGNPLITKEIISLDFDMSGLSNNAIDGTVLNFNVRIETRSVNKGNSSIVLPLRLKTNVSVDLSGKAYDNSYYIKHNENPTNFSFQHAYQITRFGATTISEASMIFRIPYRLNKMEFLTFIRKPQIYVASRLFECSVIGVPVAKPRSVEKSPIKDTIENDFDFDTIANNSRSKREIFQNNLASLSRSDATSDHTLTHTTGHEDDDNVRPQFYTMSDSGDVDVIHLNCSTSNVTCGQVVCKITSLKRAQDVVKLQLWMLFDDSKFAGGADGKEKFIHITTEGSITILDPKIKSSIPGTGINVPVTTTFHHAANVRNNVSIWVILGSILLGLVALGLITRALWKYGFFVRSKKNELERMKTSDDVPMASSSIVEE